MHSRDAPARPDRPWPPRVGEPLPRAVKAYVAAEKLAWVLSDDGHGREWAQVLHISPDDAHRFWSAIARAALDARICKVADRNPHGIVCAIEVTITVGERTTETRAVWHYKRALDAPRLVTVYPKF
jgi:hypothetical protein